VLQPEDKREALRRLIRSEDVKNALIFCNRKKDVDILHKSLSKHGFDAAALHGDMPQPKRTETLERFKKDEIRLLVVQRRRGARARHPRAQPRFLLRRALPRPRITSIASAALAGPGLHGPSSHARRSRGRQVGRRVAKLIGRDIPA